MIATPAFAASVPGAPTGVVATAGNTRAALSWSAPSSTGGAAITDYVVQYKLSSASTWSTFTDGVSTATTATVTGLTNSSAYSFQIAAVNSAGTGTYSSTATATPHTTAPDAPTAVTATPGSAQLGLSWSAPANTGGAAISDYQVQFKLTSASTWTTFTDGVSTATAATVTGLTNGTSYDVQIAAINSLGTGGFSTSVTSVPRTVPGAPTALAATPGNGQLALSWTAPGSTGGSAVTG